MARMNCENCPAAHYLKQQPENLVVNGYRNWAAGYRHADEAYWEMARNAHRDVLGPAHGQMAIDAMSSMVLKLSCCAVCPLRFYRPGEQHLCRDECLMLGMIAGAQSGDETTMFESARLLTCSNSCIEVVDRACLYAGILLSSNQRLNPIPLDAILDIETQSSRQASPSRACHFITDS